MAISTPAPLFMTFNFKVNLYLPGAEKNSELCSAAFSECSGLEMSLEPKTIREGGNNAQPIHLLGKVGYGQLNLKRGMTSDFDLWKWFEKVQKDRKLRASGDVIMLAVDGSENVKFKITGCLPVKISAPSLNAISGKHAIEEMQIAYESLSYELPKQA